MISHELSPGLKGKRVLLCSQGIPHPQRGASTVLFFQYAKGLRDAGCLVTHVLLLEGRDDLGQINEYAQAVGAGAEFEIKPCVLGRYYRVHRISRAITATPLPESLAGKLRDDHWDLVVSLDVLSAAVTAPLALAAPQVVWLGDLNFQTAWYSALYGAFENPRRWGHVPFAWIGARAWRAFYKSVLRDAASIVVSSKSSEAELVSLGLAGKYLPYPWPEPPIGDRRDLATPSVPTFLFFGTLAALGSRSAFHVLLNRLYPLLVRLWGHGNFKILIAGTSKLPAWVQNQLPAKPEVEFLGFVDDLDEVATRCHAVIAPMDIPVGNRSRIVTAMALGKLVIAHSNTSLGNPDLVSGETCLLSNTLQGFVKHMQFSVQHADQAVAIGKRARDAYERTFAPSVAVGKFLSAVASVAIQQARYPLFAYKG